MAELNPIASKPKSKKVFKKILAVLMVIVIIIVVAFTAIHSLTYIAKIDNYLSKDQNRAQLEEYVRSDNLIRNSIVVPSANIYAPMAFPEGVDYFGEIMDIGITAHPDGGKIEDNKTTIIYGPSSGYFWKEGQHKYIFTSLRAAKENDQIFVQYQDETREYKITGVKVMLKGDFDPSIDYDADLILYTEWPTGINTHYVVVSADKI